MLAYSGTGMKRGVSMMKLSFNCLVVIGLLAGGVSVYGDAAPMDPCSCNCKENQACFWIGDGANEMGCCNVDNTTKKIKCS